MESTLCPVNLTDGRSVFVSAHTASLTEENISERCLSAALRDPTPQPFHQLYSYAQRTYYVFFSVNIHIVAHLISYLTYGGDTLADFCVQKRDFSRTETEKVFAQIYQLFSSENQAVMTMRFLSPMTPRFSVAFYPLLAGQLSMGHTETQRKFPFLRRGLGTNTHRCRCLRKLPCSLELNRGRACSSLQRWVVERCSPASHCSPLPQEATGT